MKDTESTLCKSRTYFEIVTITDATSPRFLESESSPSPHVSSPSPDA